MSKSEAYLGNKNAQKGDKPRDGVFTTRVPLEDKSRWVIAAKMEKQRRGLDKYGLADWVIEQLNKASAHVPPKGD